MGYYMRYIAVDEREITLPLLESALKQIDPAYAIVDVLGESGALTCSGELYGLIEVNRPGDGLFDEELDALEEFLEEAHREGRATVLETLHNARAIVAVQVLWQGRETEDTMSKLDPLWDWLPANRQGLLRVDGEGYYDNSRLILAE